MSERKSFAKQKLKFYDGEIGKLLRSEDLIHTCGLGKLTSEQHIKEAHDFKLETLKGSKEILSRRKHFMRNRRVKLDKSSLLSSVLNSL